jgi:hypothetical protein
MGLDPVAIKAQITLIQTQLPQFAAALKQKVDAMDARLQSIEDSQKAIMNELIAIQRAMRCPVCEGPVITGLEKLPAETNGYASHT